MPDEGLLLFDITYEEVTPTTATTQKVTAIPAMYFLIPDFFSDLVTLKDSFAESQI